MYLCWWKDMNLNVYRSTTHNNTELGTSQMPINKNSGIFTPLCSNENNQFITTWSNKDGSHRYVQWRKSGKKEYVLFNAIYTKFKGRQKGFLSLGVRLLVTLRVGVVTGRSIWGSGLLGYREVFFLDMSTDHKCVFKFWKFSELHI